VFKSAALSVLLVLSSFCWSLQDPTRPVSFTAAASADTALTLESILLGPARRVAVINGKVVAEGDSVAGATIVAINKNSVRLRHRGQAVELVLSVTAIRQE